MKKVQFIGSTMDEPYETFLRSQENLWEQRLLGLIPDTVLISRNSRTITLGARSLREQLPHIRPLPKEFFDEPDDQALFRRAEEFLREKFNIPLLRTSRGGSVWYHDSGVMQFSVIAELQYGFPSEIVYPLEETLYRTMAALGVPVERLEERKNHKFQSFIGIWSNGKKLGAIGVRIRSLGRKKISQFGAAVNLAPDLEMARLINPCGITGREVTSLDEIMGPLYEEAAQRLIPVFTQKFQEVFGAELSEGRAFSVD